MAKRTKQYPDIDRSELAVELGVDRCNLTNMLNGKRKCPLAIAIAIFRARGIQLGPLAGKSRRDISTIERALRITQAA